MFDRTTSKSRGRGDTVNKTNNKDEVTKREGKEHEKLKVKMKGDNLYEIFTKIMEKR